MPADNESSFSRDGWTPSVVKRRSLSGKWLVSHCESVSEWVSLTWHAVIRMEIGHWVHVQWQGERKERRESCSHYYTIPSDQSSLVMVKEGRLLNEVWQRKRKREREREGADERTANEAAVNGQLSASAINSIRQLSHDRHESVHSVHCKSLLSNRINSAA